MIFSLFVSRINKNMIEKNSYQLVIFIHVNFFLHNFSILNWHITVIWYNMCNKIRKQKNH